MSIPLQATLLRLINQFGPLTRTELATMSGASKASISNLAGDLLEAGLLVEDEVIYGAGRPSVRLTLAGDGVCFAGVALTGEGGQALLADPRGRILAQVPLAGERLPHPDALAPALAETIAKLAAHAGLDPARIGGIGLAVPGLVDVGAGLCRRSTVLDWRDVPLAEPLSQALGLPVFADNDANALALGEHLFGGLRGVEHGLAVSIGEGIGCGHILSGALYRGYRGGAGEIAHATIALDGDPCLCGKRGCLDTLASRRAIAARAAGLGLPGDLAALDEAATRGDPHALAILHQAGSALGLALSQLVQALDPERVLVAFTAGPIDGLFARAIRQTLEAQVMPRSDGRQSDGLSDDRTARDRLLITAVPPTAWALGAASLATGRILFAL